MVSGMTSRYGLHHGSGVSPGAIDGSTDMGLVKSNILRLRVCYITPNYYPIYESASDCYMRLFT